MNRVSKRSAFALVLAFALLAGLVLFCVRYVVDAGQWVTYPGSPHLYTGSNLNTGVVFDRAGQTLLDSTAAPMMPTPRSAPRRSICWATGTAISRRRCWTTTPAG